MGILKRKQSTPKLPEVSSKLNTIKPNSDTSIHYHSLRSEIWTVLKGEGICILNGNYHLLRPGVELYVPKETIHKIWNKSSSELIIGTVAIGPNKENDITTL